MLTTLAALGGAVALKPDYADPNMYLDCVYTGFKLAELNFLPPGTRLRFYKHKIGFDYPGADIGRKTIEMIYGGTTLDFLHTLTPALYHLAMFLRPTQEDPTTRLFFLLIWKGCHRLKNSYQAAGDHASAAHIQSVPIRMVESILKGEEISPATYGISDYSKHPLHCLSCRYWCSDQRRFPFIHETLLRAAESQMRHLPGDYVSAQLTEAKKALKAYVSVFLVPAYSMPQPSVSFRPFSAMEFKQQMTPEMQFALHHYFWNWFEQEYAYDMTLNGGKWLTSMGITRSVEWLGLGGDASIPPYPLTSAIAIMPPSSAPVSTPEQRTPSHLFELVDDSSSQGSSSSSSSSSSSFSPSSAPSTSFTTQWPQTGGPSVGRPHSWHEQQGHQ